MQSNYDWKALLSLYEAVVSTSAIVLQIANIGAQKISVTDLNVHSFKSRLDKWRKRASYTASLGRILRSRPMAYGASIVFGSELLELPKLIKPGQV
jgi:hypothetical protein